MWLPALDHIPPLPLWSSRPLGGRDPSHFGPWWDRTTSRDLASWDLPVGVKPPPPLCYRECKLVLTDNLIAGDISLWCLCVTRRAEWKCSSHWCLVVRLLSRDTCATHLMSHYLMPVMMIVVRIALTIILIEKGQLLQDLLNWCRLCVTMPRESDIWEV